jgi:gas vesicle protein
LICITGWAQLCIYFCSLKIFSNVKIIFMGKAKRVLLTIVGSMAAGAILGMLFAPDEGAETRKRLKRLKQKLSGVNVEEDGNADKETLQELSETLQQELNKLNEKLKKI